MQSIRCFTNEEINSTLKDMKINKKPLMIKSDTDNFDINKFYLEPINEKLLVNTHQWTAIPKYEYNKINYDKKSGRYGDKFVLGTGAIKLTYGGIPKIHPIFLPTDDKRCFFWLYLDNSQKSSEKLFNILKKIDNYFEEEINNKQNANGIIKISKNGVVQNYKIPNQQIFVYNPIIKTRGGIFDEYDSDDNIDIKNNKFLSNLKKFKHRLRIKFSTVYNSYSTDYKYDSFMHDKPIEINTALFVQKSKNPVPLATATEMEKFFKWNSTSHFVLMLDKFWICKKWKPSGKQKIVECGFTLKCLQIVLVDKPPGYIIPFEDIISDDEFEDDNNVTLPFDIKHNNRNDKLTIYI
jgi:hypothetical protein